MRESLMFLAFLVFLFLLSFTGDWRIFAPVILISLPFVKWRRMLLLFALLLVISVPYLFFHPRGVSPGRWILMFNLRALAMAFSSAAFFSLVNPLKALSFSRELRALFSLAYAQFSSYKRTYASFFQALRSRTLKRRLGKAFFPYAGAVFGYFYKLSERRSAEMARALRSRGFYV